MQKESIKLLQTRRFLPLFVTQFLEAFNDNLFRTSLVILITYTFTSSSYSAEILVATSMALFMLPFFLFSAIAGQLADKYDKALLIQIIKAVEIFAFILASLGFYLHDITILMFTLFLLGTHSAFFGPIKYSILPDHLHTHELIGGNALIEASTFLSILFGTIIGGILIAVSYGIILVSALGLICAVIGLATSFFIPTAKLAEKNLKISINFIRETFNVIKNAHENKKVFLCILAVSWFWLIGAAILTLLPNFIKSVLNADNNVVTLFLSIFSIGIGLGSMLSEQFQQSKIDARFVPLAALGMTVFILDLFFSAKLNTASQLIGIRLFLTDWHNWRILIDLLFLSICAGIFVVPLYAIMQHDSNPSHRSRIIAANNIINAVFMVVSNIFIIVALSLGASIPIIFLGVGIVNLGVAIYVCKLLPYSPLKTFISWITQTH